jgi:hypothetical protein
VLPRQPLALRLELAVQHALDPLVVKVHRLHPRTPRGTPALLWREMSRCSPR